MPADAPIVTIGPHQVRIAAPGSFTTCTRIQTVAAHDSVCGIGAALGACWRGPGRPKVPLGQDMARFGSQFLDACVREGLPPAELRRAGTVAMQAIAAQVETFGSFWEDVEDAEGNSEGEKEPTAA